jgi:hypothetical protein
MEPFVHQIDSIDLSATAKYTPLQGISFVEQPYAKLVCQYPSQAFLGLVAN